jgi:hypothetical protein
MHAYEIHAREMHIYKVYAAIGAYLGGTRLGDVRL